jgi:hypothetical protein
LLWSVHQSINIDWIKAAHNSPSVLPATNSRGGSSKPAGNPRSESLA